MRRITKYLERAVLMFVASFFLSMYAVAMWTDVQNFSLTGMCFFASLAAGAAAAYIGLSVTYDLIQEGWSE